MPWSPTTGWSHTAVYPFQDVYFQKDLLFALAERWSAKSVAWNAQNWLIVTPGGYWAADGDVVPVEGMIVQGGYDPDEVCPPNDDCLSRWNPNGVYRSWLNIWMHQYEMSRIVQGGHYVKPSGHEGSQCIRWLSYDFWDLLADAVGCAGMGTGGEQAQARYRATKTHPDDPDFTGWEYRFIEPGDIIGEWVFDDLRLGWGLITAKYVNSFAVAEAEYADGGGWGYGYGHATTDVQAGKSENVAWVEAKEAAEDGYTYATDEHPGDGDGDFGSSYGVKWGEAQPVPGTDPQEYEFDALIEARGVCRYSGDVFYGQDWASWGGYSGALSWNSGRGFWIAACRPADDAEAAWDPYLANVADELEWHKWFSASSSTEASTCTYPNYVAGIAIGDEQWCGQPSDDHTPKWRGWKNGHYGFTGGDECFDQSHIVIAEFEFYYD